MLLRMNTADTDSQAIHFLRLPLVVLVLLIHSNFHGTSEAWNALWAAGSPSVGPAMPTLGTIIDIISGSLAQLANPFFFFIGGFLFFREGTFSKSLYLHKLRNRVSSLLIPYLIWNAIYLVALLAGERTMPGWTANIGKTMTDFTVADWLYAFWDITLIGGQGAMTAPVAIHFWFIRDLMLIALLSPVIYQLLRFLSSQRKEVPIILFMALLYATKWVEGLPGLSSQGILFFSFGAYFSISGLKFTDAMRPMRWGGLFFALFFWQFNSPNLMYAGLIVFVVSVVTRLIEHQQTTGNPRPLIPPFLANASFFIFAYHSLLVGGFRYLFETGAVNPQNGIEALGIYLLCPVILIVVGAITHSLIKKVAPGLARLLTGGR